MGLNDVSNRSPDVSIVPGAITSPLLARPGLAHAFFTREGGVSQGVYATLNGGIGSDDDPAMVHENRRRMADHLHVAGPILIPFQIHSADARVIERPFAIDERPHCDALVTTTRGLALGVTGADCGMILFADEQAGVIGAAHAGWRGALGGILHATLAAMESCGAKRQNIAAVLGPTIGRRSYEVGAEFKTRFLAEDASFARLFDAAARPDHFMFDLPGFIGFRLMRAGVTHFEDLALDTYADPQRFFSYRRKTHQNEQDYGRLVSAIALA
jgi:polyphenol oxidase